MSAVNTKHCFFLRFIHIKNLFILDEYLDPIFAQVRWPLFFFLSFLPQCSQNTKLKVEGYCIVLYEHKKGQKVKFLGAMQER